MASPVFFRPVTGDPYSLRHGRGREYDDLVLLLKQLRGLADTRRLVETTHVSAGGHQVELPSSMSIEECWDEIEAADAGRLYVTTETFFADLNDPLHGLGRSGDWRLVRAAEAEMRARHGQPWQVTVSFVSSDGVMHHWRACASWHAHLQTLIAQTQAYDAYGG